VSAAKPRMGRPSIFRELKPHRYQGNTTKTGSMRFEAARRRLAALAGWPVGKVSDGDVFEYLARGEADTVKYLKSKDAAPVLGKSGVAKFLKVE
jgi:hypothetical protein